MTTLNITLGSHTKLHSVWANMPTKSRVNAIPNRALKFYITEDASGFIVKGERDHMGPLSAGNMPTLNIRLLTKSIFYVSTTTPFYILNTDNNEESNVKNQGITNGVLIWNMETESNYFYGNATKTASYKSSIRKVFPVM